MTPNHRRAPFSDVKARQAIELLRHARFDAVVCDLIMPNTTGMDVFEHVSERPNIAAYLVSERRLPFNQKGIFRHYPELDH